MPHAHQALPFSPVACAVLSVSDTRDLASDTSGQQICALLEAKGHTVLERRVVPDDLPAIQSTCSALLGLSRLRVLLVSGGSGIARRDVSAEALHPLFERELAGFGELFRMLSFQEIGAAAMLSRAMAGTLGDRAIFLLPGSRKAVSLAMERLILPEIIHLANELSK